MKECQLHREAFLKSLTIASRTKPIRQSDSQREVCLSCSSRLTIPKRPKSLLKDFNGTDAAVLSATAAAVPAIAVSGERAPPNDAETPPERAAAFLADFERNTEKTRALHESNPGAGEGNSRLTIEIIYPASRRDAAESPRGSLAV